MRTNRTRTKLLVWSGVGLVVVIAIPLLLAAALHDPTAAANRRTIAAMTEAEREELERKYQEYLALPEAERRKLRELHKALQQDPALSQTRARYEEWSNTLSPWERLALRDEQNVESRLEIVREAREDQERKRRRDQWQLERQSRFLLRANERFNDGAIDLSVSEVEAMMDHIALSLPESAREDAVKESGKKAEDFLNLLIAALEHHLRNSKGRWPDPQLMSALIGEIESEEDREWFALVAEGGDGQHNLLQSLRYGIDHTWWRSLRWRRGFKDEDRKEAEALYEQLEEKDRQELQRLAPEERRRALDGRLFFKRRVEFEARLAELQALIAQLRLRGGWVPLPPDRRPPALTSPNPEGFSPPRPSRRDDRSRDEPRRGPRDDDEKTREPA